MSRYEDKKERIKQILQRQEELEAELRSLLEPEKVTVLPAGFSIGTEVLRIVREAGVEGIGSQEILLSLQRQYPSYGIDREKVASALAYAKNTKKSIEQTARGIYRVIENQG